MAEEDFRPVEVKVTHRMEAIHPVEAEVVVFQAAVVAFHQAAVVASHQAAAVASHQVEEVVIKLFPVVFKPPRDNMLTPNCWNKLDKSY